MRTHSPSSQPFRLFCFFLCSLFGLIAYARLASKDNITKNNTTVGVNTKPVAATSSSGKLPLTKKDKSKEKLKGDKKLKKGKK